MSNFNLITDARLSEAVYKSNNQARTRAVDGWRPVEVTRFQIEEGSTFGAQLYKNDSTGQYKVVFRGTEANLADWMVNLDYATFRNTPEFRDAVVFMARAVVQVANDERLEISKVIKYFSTTGHSQGGFLAQLTSILFNVKGTSLDGMGAVGVASQFREEFTRMMNDEGVGELAGNHVLGKNDFLTRQYTAVGYLGRHAGDTDGAWSWSLQKIGLGVAAITSAGTAAATVLLVGLKAHPIASIIANEERRERSALWRVIGDATDALNSPRTVVGELLGERRAVLLASLGGGVPLPLPILDVSPATRQALEEFLSQYHGQSVDSWVDPDNKTLRLTTLSGDTLELLSDSRIIVRQTLGTTATQTELKADASISDELAVQMLENNDGHTQMLVTRRNAQTDSALVMDVATHQIISGQTVELGAQGQPLQTTRYTRAQNGTLQSSIHDAGGQLIRQVSVQTFDDGTALEIKTEGGVQHMRSVVLRDDGSGAVQASAWTSLPGGPAGTPQTQHDNMYADMAGFVNALRGRDKVSQVLYAARIGIGYQRSLPGGAGDVTLGWLDNGVQALSAVAGVYAGLRALRSDDVKTQLGGAVGLLSSAQEACSQRRAVEVTTQGRRAREWGRASTPRSRVRTSPVWGRRGLPPLGDVPVRAAAYSGREGLGGAGWTSCAT